LLIRFQEKDMFKALLLVMASMAGGLVSADEGEQEGGAVTEGTSGHPGPKASVWIDFSPQVTPEMREEMERMKRDSYLPAPPPRAITETKGLRAL